MKTSDIHRKTIDHWWTSLRHLSADIRLELASRLINSLKKSEEATQQHDWKQLYGAWADETESAEEMIERIRDSRTQNRNIESFD